MFWLVMGQLCGLTFNQKFNFGVKLFYTVVSLDVYGFNSGIQCAECQPLGLFMELRAQIY